MPLGAMSPEISEKRSPSCRRWYIRRLYHSSSRRTDRLPDTAMPVGASSPEISAASLVVPENGAFTDRAGAVIRDERIGARQRNIGRLIQARDQRSIHSRPGGGVFADRTSPFASQQNRTAGDRDAQGAFTSGTGRGSVSRREVVYRDRVSQLLFTKIVAAAGACAGGGASQAGPQTD